MVGWKFPPKDVSILNPGTCEWFVDVIALRILEWGDYLRIAKWVANTTVCVFVRARLIESRRTQAGKKAWPRGQRLEWFSWKPPETRVMYLKFHISKNYWFTLHLLQFFPQSSYVSVYGTTAHTFRPKKTLTSFPFTSPCTKSSSKACQLPFIRCFLFYYSSTVHQSPWYHSL